MVNSLFNKRVSKNGGKMYKQVINDDKCATKIIGFKDARGSLTKYLIRTFERQDEQTSNIIFPPRQETTHLRPSMHIQHTERPDEQAITTPDPQQIPQHHKIQMRWLKGGILLKLCLYRPSFFLQTLLFPLFLMASRALHYRWLPEEGFQTGLSTLIALQLLHSALHPRFSKAFFPTKEFFKGLFVDIFLPLQLEIICNVGLLEEFSRLLKREVLLFRQDELYLSIALVLGLAVLEDSLDAVELLDEFVGLDGTDTLNFRGVIAATENTHVDELFLSKIQVFEGSASVDLREWLLPVIYVTDHCRRSKHQTICVFSADRINFTVFVHITALSLGLARSLNHRDAHQTQHMHHVFALFLRNICSSLLLLERLGQVTDFLRLLTLLSSLLLDLSTTQELTILFCGRFPVEYPHRLDAILDQKKRPVEESQQVAGLVAFSISE